MGWVRVPYAEVPKLEPDGDPKDWASRVWREGVPSWAILGGSYAFARDEEGNLWFISWSPFGDECGFFKKEAKRT